MGIKFTWNDKNILLATVKTTKKYSSNPPTHLKRQYDVLRGKMNMVYIKYIFLEILKIYMHDTQQHKVLYK